MLSTLFSLLPLLPLLPLLSGVLATPEHLERNLNYRSPFHSAPSLALNTKEIHARHLASRQVIKREIERAQVIERRQAKTAAPSGKPADYPLGGYGLGVVDWEGSQYIYAGNLNFTHSVASGDPFDNSIILWTRAIPSDKYAVDVPQCVTYQVFDGENGQGKVVSQGWALTSGDVDWTVKVEATGLSASKYYSYQFANCAKPDNKSPIGKTRTAPAKFGKNIATQRFAVYSCSNYPNGFFSAYSGPVVHNDADYVVHLGDYIYEGGTGGAAIGRVPSKSRELATLDDYRRRYDQYRADVDLAAMHKNFPIFAIWDDHETADNDWKAGSADSNNSISTGGCAYSNNSICFSDRAVNAKRAYFEWIPIRQVDLTDQGRIWRDFRFGDLLDIVALDTRKYDRDLTDLYYNTEYVKSLAVDITGSRSMVGEKQERWIEQRLSESQQRGTVWKFVLNQVIFGSVSYKWTAKNPDTATFTVNYDSWDGYQANRRRLLQHVNSAKIDNTIMVTGDTHANWLLENSLDTTLQGSDDISKLRNVGTKDNKYVQGQIVEYAGTAVSSNGWANSYGSYENSTGAAAAMVKNNPPLLYADGFHRGYMNVAINYTHVETSWYEYPGNQQARVPDNRQLAFRAVQKAGMNQVQRPLQQPQFGAIKPGSY